MTSRLEQLLKKQEELKAQIHQEKNKQKEKTELGIVSDSRRPIFYRSSGLLFGKYLPSENDLSQGILMTDQGLFPTIVTESILKFFTRDSKNKTVKKKHHFVFYVRGLSEAPHYQFYLISRSSKNNLPKLFSENNTFLSQGIVTERTTERVILRVQKNPLPDRTSQDIQDSINYLEIRGCPGKVRTSQFWSFRSHLQDGFLHFQSGELLANAKTAKPYLKIP